MKAIEMNFDAARFIRENREEHKLNKRKLDTPYCITKKGEISMIQEVHEKLLQLALEHRDNNPTFTFHTRQNKDPKGRLQAGYWFQGNEKYVFFSPYKKGDCAHSSSVSHL